MKPYQIKKFPRSRIATRDVCAVSLKKHHIAALIEIDVTESRQKLRQYKKQIQKVSLTAWLIKVISRSIQEFAAVGAYQLGKRRAILFNDVTVSIAVEKELNGQKIPIPLLLEKVNERSIESITQQIDEARNQILSEKDIVLQKRSNRLERIYYFLPGFVRRGFWHYLLRNPRFAYRKMGNVAITAVGMMGRADGWFIPLSVHPICFGMGSITKKPRVVKDQIQIREMMKMTVLIDHSVVDGAEMARFISKLSVNIEKGIE